MAITVALLAGVGVLVGISGDDEAPAAIVRPSSDLDEVLAGFAETLRPDARYQPPSANERTEVVAALRPLLEDGRGIDRPHLADSLRPLGFTLTIGRDPATGREYALVASDRAWGLYLIDLSEPVRVAVEVPHPNSDLGTERIGLALFRAVPGTALLVAGTHRRVERGDVAHRTDSAFHALATDLAERDIPQVQVHGFHDDSLPDTDVVISPGAGKAGATIRRIADGMAGAGLATCRSWERECGRLEGTRNEQGKVAAEQEADFVHLEMSRSVRDDESQWARLVDPIAEGLPK